MIEVNEIRKLSKRIAEEFRAEKVILFGSYANGKARPDSDVDLLVIMSFKGGSILKAAEIVRRLDPPFGVDLIVRTAKQIRRRLALNDFFVRDIMATGKTLYAAHNRREET